ncbi:exopolysaccharide biosynthesis protein, WecB/TagA/CpsF family [Rivularia sp. PCC 7116]|uniref:WecB/TagA/CpsF family glycosyltransferase n=1 Tax=Rivularia sp. PCC 7116 TaxID=373994 RepID=UPI00029F3A22|nr:WecB/TagA/CpsF family glycosyltransferase [Rivularia sp. PCC 7116]AFY56287.1 exopolysaccharide biosynthesis protein, WecB/TagA/CpsF family [Rivularia sp. PCC 7116]
MTQVQLLNVNINNVAMSELLEKLQSGGLVVTPNVDHLMKLQRDRDFYGVYQDAEYRVCDSKILMYVSHFLGTPIQEKISGSDLFPAFYAHYRNDERIKIFLLGAQEGIAETARRNINSKVGRNMIIDTYSPPFGFEKDEQECQKIIDLINSSDATVLAIGVGAPKQEMWVAKHRKSLHKVKIFLAIGATINFEAGNIKRSPKWMSEVGLEWLYRLLSEPKRLWKRYLMDSIPFIYLVCKQRFQLYRNPWSKAKRSQTNNILSVVRGLKKM